MCSFYLRHIIFIALYQNKTHIVLVLKPLKLREIYCSWLQDSKLIVNVFTLEFSSGNMCSSTVGRRVSVHPPEIYF